MPAEMAKDLIHDLTYEEKLQVLDLLRTTRKDEPQ